MKRLFSICYVLLFSCSILPLVTFAQAERGNSYYGQQKNSFGSNNDGKNTLPAFVNDTTIQLNVKAIMNVKPDSYVVILGISQVALSLDSCQKIINDRINALLNRLAKSGIRKEDTYTDFISQIPVYETITEKRLFSRNYNEIPKGFDLKKNLHIAYKDPAVLEIIMSEAAKSEIYDVVKIDNVITRQAQVYDTLRKAALVVLKNKVEEFIKNGIKFNSTYQIVSEDLTVVNPADRYQSYTAFSNPSLLSTRKEGKYGDITASKTETIYYEKVPYHFYEVVINPRVLEPVPQFTYHLSIRYIYKKVALR